MNAKTIILLIIYMLLVYTTTHAFTIASADHFVVGGDRDDLMKETDEVSPFNNMIVLINQNRNLTLSQRFDLMNDTYGTYKGVEWRQWGWLNLIPRRHHIWINDAGMETAVLLSDFDKYLAGTLTADDIGYLRGAAQVFESIWKGLGYVTGLLTFNIVGSATLSDGSKIPPILQFIPLLMVLIPWLIITYWILPYAIKLLKAIGGLIPFT